MCSHESALFKLRPVHLWSSHAMQSTSTSSLKRSRANSLPSLPKIKGEIILQVFTHHSLRRGPDLEDNARLCALGSTALDAAVTFSLFQMRPMEDTATMSVSIVSLAVLIVDS